MEENIPVVQSAGGKAGEGEKVLGSVRGVTCDSNGGGRAFRAGAAAGPRGRVDSHLS